MNKLKTFVVVGLVLALGLVLSACGGSEPAAEQQQEVAAVELEKSQQALERLSNEVLSTGPNGKDATPASEITLTDEELEQIQGMNATAAIAMHYGGNDWARGQIKGLEDQFEKMGIEVISTTDANFEPAKQVSDIETVLSQDPDILVSLPTDPAATADVYKQAAEQGVELVFMDNVPNDLKQGEDYVSIVSADNYGAGAMSAHLMASELGGEGKIGAIYDAADFFVTRQRYEGFRDTIEQEYEDIEIVEEQGIGGPGYSSEAQSTASAMLTEHADLAGIWGVWDVPSEGIIAAARNAGRTDLTVTTVDLGEPVAIDMVSEGIVQGLAAQLPFDQGVTEAKLAGYGLLDKEAPPYVALSTLPVTKENVFEAWRTVYQEDPPESVREAAQ